MAVKPELGAAAGQKYPVLRSIQIFLGQMAEGGARAASAVIKELLQNADDAGATDVSVVLDERTPPAGMPQEYADLLVPALFVRNNARFRVARDVGPTDQDDFSAICDVASGHKRAQATAAGRFGIGFNSVYFLTDTPLFFSRREVHVFDLLHKVFDADGWRFPLEDFPAHSGSFAGPVKPVLEWSFPKAVLVTRSFSQFASDPTADFDQTVFRLPLRRSPEDVPSLYIDRFPAAADRVRLLNEAADEAVRSILFLKNVLHISFGVLRDREVELFAAVDASAPPPEFSQFLSGVRQQDAGHKLTEKRGCEFDRTITRRNFAGSIAASASDTTWSFHVRHLARFDDEHLAKIRDRLRLNGERAVPWVSVGVPLNPEACRLDGTSVAAWRVFLPLLEEGPCACVLSGAFFVGPSRQRTEFRLNESDEGKRRTEWNQLLVERGLVPLLQDVSADLPSLAPGLLDEHPKDYVSLFPTIYDSAADPSNLTEFLGRCFSSGLWALRLRDIWGEAFDLLIGGSEDVTNIELIPEWLLKYRDRFVGLSGVRRRFVRYALGDALSTRITRNSSISVRRRPSGDVALAVLQDPNPPDAKDLRQLLLLVADSEQPLESLEGVWGFASTPGGELLRFDPNTLYVVVDDTQPPDSLFEQLRRLGLQFVRTEWVRKGAGLTDLLKEFRDTVQNVVEPSAGTVLELLRRLPEANAHDVIAHHYDIKPIVDFLVGEPRFQMTPDLRLGFLVRTANQKVDRRRLGIILLKPTHPTPEDGALWEIWFRRLFAEVDPDFARECQRLLAAHPTALEMLHSSDCHVAVARVHNAIRILADERVRQSDLYEALQREINEAAKAKPDVAARLASAVLEIADAAWESLSVAQRRSILALPIHRLADGRFVPLVSVADADVTTLAQRFRLQSHDDVEDAPVRLQTYELLQTVSANVKQFYRRRLGLEEHGRVSALKDVLRQIGNAASDNEAMLRYLVRYYDETLVRLERSGEETDAEDARDLKALFSSARTVPCADGSWQQPHACMEAWQVFDHLANQGWPQTRLPLLVQQIFAGGRIASFDKWVRRLLPRLHGLSSANLREIPMRALTSEASDLSLADRVKLLRDNRHDLPDTNVTRSSAAGQAEVPVLGGRTSLDAAEWIRDQTDLPLGLLRRLAPKAIDLSALAGEVAIPARDLPPVLNAFQVQATPARDIEDRLVQQFSQIWPRLDTTDRLTVLRYVGERGLATRLRDQAVAFDTVLISSKPAKWLVPASVVAPRWVATQPPYLEPEQQPTVPSHDTVAAVWDSWCGLTTFGDVLGRVLDGAERTGATVRTATVVYQWIERAIGAPPGDAELSDLQNHSWVLGHRGDSFAFRYPSEILLHAGDDILGARFWVPALPLPRFTRGVAQSLGFTTTLAATPETLQQLGECLVERARVDEDAAMEVYGLVEQMVEDSESLREQWQNISERLRVFRLFRAEDRQVTSLELFIGDADHQDDLSASLACLKSGSTAPKGTFSRYRRLGVADRPTVRQILVALGGIDAMQPDARRSYARLIGALHDLGEESVTQEPLLAGVRVLTCSGSFESVLQSYWDQDFGHRHHIVPEHASLLIDANDKSTQRLVEWLRQHGSDAPVPLRSVAQLAFAEGPFPIDASPDVSHMLLPWRQWADEVVREESMVRDALAKSGLVPANRPLKIVPVERMRIRCSLPDGKIIDQRLDWAGPTAIGTPEGSVFVRVLPHEQGGVDADRVSVLDAAIAREIAILWGRASDDAVLKRRADEILSTLERPSTVLRRLRETYRQHFLHQYQDQVADPDFAELFDEYQRTRRPSRRAEELEQRMHDLLQAGFVNARREQIRGYGYDEFSVFAELLQNGEDAYAQRAQLGMQMPRPCGIGYWYLRAVEGSRVLHVEHHGRPFNYWKHGARQNRAFSRDVEGVLRSAGSFKPHSDARDTGNPETPSIGRFGLGFKSVYLLTDLPEIHSGAWHFAIEAGCLPKELARPSDLAGDVTRVRLPLRTDAQELRDASRLIDLVPFLRLITHLEFHTPDADAAVNVDAGSDEVLVTESAVVERVVISAPGVIPDAQLQFLRCRSPQHAGQIGLLLTKEGAPARWRDAFSYDLFAALPLRAELGCGVAVSHRFEVQSGRTHLVDPQANERLIQQAAGLLDALVAGLCAANSSRASESLRRFWAVWRWERGDAECEGLRKTLARVLVGLPLRAQVVPTLAPDTLTSLAEGPRFFFAEIPNTFREALVNAQVTVSASNDRPTALSQTNVVAEGFAGAYRRACDYAGIRAASTLIALGWGEIATAFRERPWFAEKPELLCCLGAAVNEEQFRTVAAWVALCHVLGEDGQGRPAVLLPGELLPQEFPGKQHLPRRFLAQVSGRYDEPALTLLRDAGLRPSPSSDDIREWVIAADLTTTEAIGVLRYLAEDDRFRSYWELADLFRSHWLPVASGRISSADAAASGVIPEDVLTDRLFCAWLGIGTGETPVSPEPVGPTWDPQQVLTELFDWWQVHGTSWTARYQKRLYPTGQPPNVRRRFNPQDLDDRREWIALLVLGSLHTLGRTQLEQHRDFLRRCDTKGWLDVFVDAKHDGQRWIEVLEEYLDDPVGTHDYYLWMKQFVVIFQISRWLPEYVDALLNVDRFKRPFGVDEIIAPRTSASFSGGGPDAPALTRGLGMGACFVFRELTRLGILNQPFAYSYCYVPARRVCTLLDKLGAPEIGALPSVARSSAIHRFLVEQLGEQRATFAGSFDLPLLALVDTPDLQDTLLGGPLVLDDDA